MSITAARYVASASATAPDPVLDYTPEVAHATASIRDRLRTVVPDLEWPVHAPYIAAISELKRARGAVVLAHNYQAPEIFHGVADITGDSLALAQARHRDRRRRHRGLPASTSWPRPPSS